MMVIVLDFYFFFFNDTATTEIYTLSLHDALPIHVRDPSSESVRTFNDLLAGSTTTSPWTLNAVAPDVEAAKVLAEKLRKIDVVGRVVTVADYIPDSQQEKLDIIEDVAMFIAPPPGPDGRVPPPTPEQKIEALRGLDG